MRGQAIGARVATVYVVRPLELELLLCMVRPLELELLLCMVRP